MKLDQVIIVGVGLIGSSIGRDLIQKKIARQVVGVGRNRTNLAVAHKQRAIHQIAVIKKPQDLRKLAFHADLVILATPVSTIKDYLRVLCGMRVRVMDVGSTKSTLLPVARGVNFIAAHPIAGTEQSGAAGGKLNLFKGRKCLLVPTVGMSSELRRFAHQFWKALGSKIIELDAATHDRILGAVSHLPHAVAYSLVTAVAKMISVSNETRFALGGLRDTVRIAASPPEMWTDIFLENRRFVSKSLVTYQRELSRLTHLIQKNNRTGLLKFLKQAQAIRLQIP